MYAGFVVSHHYDPLLSKLVAWAPTRALAIDRLVRALGEYTVHGVTTNVAWLAAALEHPAFRAGDYDTGFCARHAAELVARAERRRFEEVALVAAAVAAFKRDHEQAETFATRARAAGAGPLRLGAGSAARAGCAGGAGEHVRRPARRRRRARRRCRCAAPAPGSYEVRLRGKVHVVDAFRLDFGTLSLLVDQASYSAMLDWRDTKVNVRLRHAIVPLELLDERRLRLRRAAPKLTIDGRQAVTAPVAGVVRRVLVAEGDAVKAGQALAVVEALEMENELRSPKDGRVVGLQRARGAGGRGEREALRRRVARRSTGLTGGSHRWRTRRAGSRGRTARP